MEELKKLARELDRARRDEIISNDPFTKNEAFDAYRKFQEGLKKGSIEEQKEALDFYEDLVSKRL